MTALATNRTSILSVGVTEFLKSYPVKAGAVIHKGGGVSSAAGFARALTVADGVFLGLAEESVTGGAADGDKSVIVRVQFEELATAITGITAASQAGVPLYAVDDSMAYTTNNSGALAVGEYSGTDGTKFRATCRGVNAT
jgi:hypothetical protein